MIIKCMLEMQHQNQEIQHQNQAQMATMAARMEAIAGKVSGVHPIFLYLPLYVHIYYYMPYSICISLYIY